MSLITYIVIWACLAAFVAALALVRFFISRQEDDHIHLSSGGEELISKQMAFITRLDAVNRWGKSLTVLTVVTGLILAGIYLNQVFQGNPTPLG